MFVLVLVEEPSLKRFGGGGEDVVNQRQDKEEER